MTVNWSERMISHNETETRFILLREAAVRNSTMGKSLMEQYRVGEEGLWIVNLNDTSGSVIKLFQLLCRLRMSKLQIN